jgi:hypothetical protein
MVMSHDKQQYVVNVSNVTLIVRSSVDRKKEMNLEGIVF